MLDPMPGEAVRDRADTSWSSAHRAIARRLAVWLAGSAAGVIVLALPDAGPRLVSFSEDHGPSAVDAVGIAILIAAWLPVVGLLWSRRGAIRGPHRWWAAALGVTGAALLAGTVGFDLGASWVIAALMLLATQLVMLRAVWVATG